MAKTNHKDKPKIIKQKTMRKKLHFKLSLLVMLLLLVAPAAMAQDVTAVWDFQNNLSEGINTATNFEKKTGTVASTVEGITLYVDASSGKLKGRDTDAQFNSGTILQVPVKSAKDVVTVTSYPNCHNYTVGGVAATADVTEHKATTAEATQGYVEIKGTGSSYLYQIKVVQAGAIQEKRLYSTSFTEWDEVKASAESTTVIKKTLYSKESFTFTLTNVAIDPDGTQGKFPEITGYMQTAKYTGTNKDEEPSAVTSALANITKITLHQAATGGNRGIKVSVKGDGDDDWVVLHNQSIGTAAGEDLSLDVNRTNCQIKFEAFAPSQNAYVTDLAIYGNVDMSKTPMLGSFTLNGTKYEAADIFEEDNTGKQLATINVSKKATLITRDNPLTDITADNGTIKSTTYTTTGEDADKKTVVAIVVEANNDAVTYELTVGFKPDFTLTYYNIDGTTVLATQQVEQDAAITAFVDDEDAKGKVTVANGKKFRGWAPSFKKDEKKYTVNDIITADAALYPVVTYIETKSDTARYDYNLQNEGFDAADHEAFVVDGTGKWHDTTHGWVFSASDKINLLMGGKGYIKLNLCQYSNGTITLTDPSGNAVNTVEAKASKDGALYLLQNTATESGTYVLSFSGTTYLHSLSIVNMQEEAYEQYYNYYLVKKGDVNSFITTLETVNAANAASSAARSYIILPDGTYDLAERCLTTISGNNISIIGESMDNTIIVNTPEAEGIAVTATLYNTSTGLYMQDLTLKNAYPFIIGATAGRAVCLQDKGTQTICKNVKMLSYQDTYYSNNSSGKYYFENSDIHGIVDFICGGGDAFFNKCTITLEPGKNSYITAPFTDGTNYGYVFDGCKIVGTENYKFDFGRSWGGTARCAFLNTVLDANAAKNISTTRWTTTGMNVIAENFWEYNTLDESGKVISPEENIVTFTKDGKTNTYNTIMTADKAAEFALDKVFASWKPANYTVQNTVSDVVVNGSTLTWTSSADYYLVKIDDKYYWTNEKAVDLSKFDIEDYKKISVRAANSMGGLGEAGVYANPTGIKGISSDADVTSSVYYTVDGVQVSQPKHGINIVVNTFADGTKKTSKVVVK